jgi:hypothetical protein
MNKRLGTISIILAISILIMAEFKHYPNVYADLSNNNNDNNNPNNPVDLKIPLPFDSHIASQTIDDDKKKYIDNILPFP